MGLVGESLTGAHRKEVPTRLPDWKHVLPFLAGLASFVVLAILNEARGFDLWRNYALSGLFLGGLTTFWVWKADVRVPHYIQWVIVAGLLLHYGGGTLGSPDPYRMGLFGFHGINGAYHTIEGWDHVTHAVGLGAGAMACAYLIEVYTVRRGLSWSTSAVAGVAFLAGLTAGVGVELYEFLGKTAFQTIDQGGYSNTMSDLQWNVLGCAAGAVIAATIDRRRFRARIQQHWHAPLDPTTAWRVPPGMVGIIAFCLPPSAATLFLAARFPFQDVPSDDSALYDDALVLLLRSAITGILLGLGTFAWRRRAERKGVAA